MNFYGGMIQSENFPYYQLSNIDIDNYLKKHSKGFVGCFMRDQNPQAHLTPNSNCVINLDTSKGVGTHWVALHMDSNGSLNFYDPLGGKPLKSLGNIKYSDQIQQPPSTDLCGFYCIKWILSKH